MKQKQVTNNPKMTKAEFQASASLALIFFLRMFGLFMILPVFSLYALDIDGATPLLMGLAIGIYGLTQAIFQIPFGALSDRIGRKPVITLGLIIFAIGSVVAAMSENIYIMILGRALQGAGAISASVMALAADLTREDQRTKAMALIGICIGFAFMLAFILGPLINIWVGLNGLFWLASLLALAAIIVLFSWVPKPTDIHFHKDYEAQAGNFSAVLKNPDLLRLDLSIFILHLVLTASFVVIPLALRDIAGLESTRHWQAYLPIMLLSIIFMAPFIRLAQQNDKAKPIFLGAIILLAVAETGLWLGHASLTNFLIMMLLFFTAFNYLEAALPSLVSVTAPKKRRGTALGIYSTSQFLGAFIGGTLGGWLFGALGIGSIFLINAVLIIIWCVIVLPMRIQPRNK